MAKTKIRYRNRFRRGGGRRRAKFSLPVAIVAGFIPPAAGVWSRRSSATAVGEFLKGAFIGLDSTGSFRPALLRDGALPVVGGFIAHMIASRLGINRALARAGIPILRI